jgi:putative ABC transport system permease protein
VRVSTKEKRGILTGVFPAEIALGIGNSVSKKKTLVLMSASIAISIILFLGFQVFVSFMYASMKVNKPYTADISLTSESSLSYNLYTELSEMDGINRIYGRMFGYVEAAFDASRLTDAYQQVVGDVKISADGLFEAPEQSWLISYDKNQLKWAKIDLLGGTLSEEKLNEKNGIIAVVQNIRQGVSMETASLKLGDQIRIQTIQGPRDYTVMGILRSVPFSDNRLNLATFITTEKLYTEITGDTTLDVIDIQLKKANQEQTVSELKSKIEDHVNFFDSRQKNEEATQAFLTMAVFMYGFVIVIAFISILNIINTMHTSVSAKTRYLGVMRAIGMSGKQLNKMIVTEAGTYALAGSIAGIILGVLLQRFLVTTLLSGVHMKWEFPLEQVMIIFVIALVVTLLSVMAPLKKLKSKGISENIGSLQ